MAKKPTRDIEQEILQAAMDLFAEKGYGATRMVDIAERADVDLGELRSRARDKADLVTLTVRKVDLAVLGEDAMFGPEESVRDRLFDLFMRRFDGLQPYQAGIRAVAEGVKRDPATFLCLTPGALEGLAWYLEAAGERADGCLGMLRVKALSLVWLQCLRVFIEDDSDDLAKTMSTTDKALSQAEKAAGWFNIGPRAKPASETEPEAEPL